MLFLSFFGKQQGQIYWKTKQFQVALVEYHHIEPHGAKEKNNNQSFSIDRTHLFGSLSINRSTSLSLYFLRVNVCVQYIVKLMASRQCQKNVETKITADHWEWTSVFRTRTNAKAKPLPKNYQFISRQLVFAQSVDWSSFEMHLWKVNRRKEKQSQRSICGFSLRKKKVFIRFHSIFPGKLINVITGSLNENIVASQWKETKTRLFELVMETAKMKSKFLRVLWVKELQHMHVRLWFFFCANDGSTACKPENINHF